MRAFLLLAMLAAPVLAQDVDPDDEAAAEELGLGRGMARNVGRLLSELKQQPWEEHYGYMMDSYEKVFDRYGWDSESDLFALELIAEVESVPPWSMQERFDTLIGKLGDRYFLDEDQESRLRQMFIRDSTQLFSRHSDKIMTYGMEMIQTRMSGEAFTPEKVARWTKLGLPVLADARRMMESSSKELMEFLDPEQREMVRRDYDAANRRMDGVQEMTSKWAQGDWDAAEWGMEEDPIQLAAMQRAEPETGAIHEENRVDPTERKADDPEGESPPPTRQAPRRADPQRKIAQNQSGDPSPGKTTGTRKATGPDQPDDPWARYVRAFIEKYKLTDAQQQRAWLIYGDASQRGDRVRKGADERLTAMRSRSGTDPEAIKAQEKRRNTMLSGVFDQMKRRLERLPTRAQRRDASPGELKLETDSKANPKGAAGKRNRRRAPRNP